MKPISEVYNMDCLEYMKTIPDKFFDLCIADPPYGINVTKMTLGNGKNKVNRGTTHWDAKAPDMALFNEIIRVSKKQIIWGANHFISKIPYDSSCWIVWDKGTGANDFADCELAWTSFQKAVRKYFQSWVGSNAKEKSDKMRIHPTQKPIALYAWLLDNYAIGGGKIFDPFLGSGSSRIAAYKKGFDFYGCELDEEYFTAQEERFRRECFGEQKLKNGTIIVQNSLF